MKIYLIEKSENRKMINAGGKIKFEKLKEWLNSKNSVLLVNSDGKTQSNLRIRKVPEKRIMDRGYKIVKAHYIVNLEMGNEGFENFTPKKVIFEQNYRFANLDRLLNMLEAKQGLIRRDWVIDSVKE